MPAPTRRSASTMVWTSPTGDRCSLSPMSGGQGLLEIEMFGEMVAVHSRNCMLTEGDEFTELAEFEFNISMSRCMITWACTERTADTEIERSAFFSQ